MTEHPLRIPSRGQVVSAVLHLPRKGQWPCVIAAHGLLSTKENEKYVNLAQRVARYGIALCRFDFRGCGQSEGRLADTTVEGRIADLEAVVTFLQAHAHVAGERLGLFGSSLGGYVALFVALRDARVKATVTLASPVDLRDMLGQEQSLTNMGLGEVFLDELERGTFLEAPYGVSNLLVIHGEDDEVVPASHATRIFDRSHGPKALEIIPGADHRFSDPAHRDEALRLAAEWFHRYL